VRRASWWSPLALVVLPLTAPPLAAQFYGPPTGFTVENPVLRHLWALGMDSSQAATLGQVLFDSLGPRLTASPGMEAAQHWLLRTYQSWGVTARQERYGTWRGWRRGPTHLDLVVPRVRTLESMTLAWSPGTPKGRSVRAPAVVLPDVADSTAFAAWLPQAKGKFVLASFGQPTCRPDDSWEKWATTATFDSMKAERHAALEAWNQRLRHAGYAPDRRSIQALQRRLDDAGVAGIITNTWSQGWGVDKIFDAVTTRAPVVDVSCEDYGLVFRLAEHGQGPVLQLQAESEALGEVPVFNVVAEIPGAELPHEYVMLSAHFDSWDGGSGATDNGTGSIIMLEAMRLLQHAYPHPRRTILVGHWSGEEQGLVGSRAFVQDHPEITDSLQALFNQDNGTGRIQRMSSSGFTMAAGNLARYLSQIPADLTGDITFSFPGMPSGGGTDHASFVSCGAPGFGLGSGEWDYFRYTWHTNRDTEDKISWRDVRDNATLVAMLVYLAAEDPQWMPRDRRDVFPERRNGQPGGWPECAPPERKTPQP
jgi:carboxypeptidase Q